MQKSSKQTEVFEADDKGPLWTEEKQYYRFNNDPTIEYKRRDGITVKVDKATPESGEITLHVIGMDNKTEEVSISIRGKLDRIFIADSIDKKFPLVFTELRKSLPEDIEAYIEQCFKSMDDYFQKCLKYKEAGQMEEEELEEQRKTKTRMEKITQHTLTDEEVEQNIIEGNYNNHEVLLITYFYPDVAAKHAEELFNSILLAKKFKKALDKLPSLNDKKGMVKFAISRLLKRKQK